MMESDDIKIGLKAKIIAVSVIVLFVAIVIAIASLLSIGDDKSAVIVNRSQISEDSDLQKYSKDIATGMYSFLKLHGYDIPSSEIVVRNSIVYDGDIAFIIDIDSIRQTYRFVISADGNLVTCPTQEESKYPDSYCIGGYGDNDDTATMALEDDIPYDGSANGIDFRIYRKYPDHNVYVYVYACESDTVKSAVESEVKKFIKSRNANPEVFPLVYEFNGCSN